jgi:hypothetical protein
LLEPTINFQENDEIHLQTKQNTKASKTIQHFFSGPVTDESNSLTESISVE